MRKQTIYVRERISFDPIQDRYLGCWEVLSGFPVQYCFPTVWERVLWGVDCTFDYVRDLRIEFVRALLRHIEREFGVHVLVHHWTVEYDSNVHPLKPCPGERFAAVASHPED